MITRNALAAVALATTCLVPLAASAQDATPSTTIAGTPFTGEIGVGVMGVMGTNPDQAGRYNGLNTTGIDILGDFDLTGRAPWNSGGTRYYELQGNNLVFQTGNDLGSGIGSGGGWASSTNNSLVNAGSLGFKAGDQGTWEAGINFNSITYTGNVIDSLYTVNGSQGFLNPGLTPWGGATSTAQGPIHATSYYTTPYGSNPIPGLKPVQVGTRRDSIGANFNYIWGDWTFSGAFRHEHKDGSLEESVYGAYSGMAFALPVDYDTDRYDATAAYTTRQIQASLQYTFSHFSNNNTFVNLPSPISGTAAPYQQSAAYSLPPSNEAHYLTLMVGANDLIPKTRVNLNARVGLEKQDDTFAPNTADPNPYAAGGLPGISLLNGQLQGTTANSLNAIATVYQVKLSAASNPFTNVTTRVYYGLDGRSVNLNQYQVLVGGGGGRSTDSTMYSSGTTPGYAFVVPQDWLKQNAGAELGYKLIPEYDTRMTVGYRLDSVARSNAQVGHSWTNTGSVGVSSELGPQVNGKLSFDYASRSATMNYVGPWSYLGQGATYSGAYYQAPMTSEAVTLRTDYTPSNTLSGDLYVQFKNEDYTYGDVPAGATATGSAGGIKQDYALTIGPDINWRPRKNVNVHLFYTYELLFFNNLGNGACSTPASLSTAACAGSAGYFQNKNTTATNTVGISGEWQVNDKLKLRADYTVSVGAVMFSQFNGVFVANPTASNQNVSNYPDINSLMNSVNVRATYQVAPNMELIGWVGFSSYHDNNWYDTANAAQGNGISSTGTYPISIMTPGYSAPNYNIVTVMTGVRFKL